MENQIIALIVGLISSGLIQGAKKVQSIPLNSGQVVKLRIVLAVLVLAGNVLNAFLNGDLENFAASEQVNIIINSAASWVFAHFVYKVGIKNIQ